MLLYVLHTPLLVTLVIPSNPNTVYPSFTCISKLSFMSITKFYTTPIYLLLGMYLFAKYLPNKRILIVAALFTLL